MAMKNPLLVRDDVGRAKQSCYDLPDEHFSYGRPGNQDNEGAREVSMQWVCHTPSRNPEGSAPDFMVLNKRATAAKITTSRDLKQFKNLMDTSVAKCRDVPQAKDVVPSDVIRGFTYGRKVRPSTPIQEVISYRFAEKSEKELNRFYSDVNQVQEASKAQVRKIPLTAASRGHASAAKKAIMTEDDKELFKLGKFKRVGPKVLTYHQGSPRVQDLIDDDMLDHEASLGDAATEVAAGGSLAGVSGVEAEYPPYGVAASEPAEW